MTFKSTAVRGKCWKRARWSKSIWKILVKRYVPNTFIIVKINSQGSLKIIYEKSIVEKPTLNLQVSASLWLSPCPVAEERVPPPAGWLVLAVVKGLWHLQQSPLGALHPLAGLAFLCAALCHWATAILWKTLLNMSLELVNAICLSEELYFNACAKLYEWTLHIYKRLL